MRDFSALMFNSEATSKVNNWACAADGTVNKKNKLVIHPETN